MAGIGWKLERMLERDTLSSTLQAYLTGVAVTCAPWLLTTAVLVTLRTLARGSSAGAELGHIELVITLSYAVTLVLSAPIHVVVSRFAADRLYEKRLAVIGQPLRETLAATLVVFLMIGAALGALVAPSFSVAVLAALLTAIVAGQWLLLAVGGGMSSPSGVLGAFALGAAVSVLSAAGLEHAAGLGARGYLFGFTFGQAVALFAMLFRIMRDLPSDEAAAPPGALRRAFRDYRVLAVSALLVQAAVWIDKVCTWLLRGAQDASALASASALAWFAVIPAFAWIYVQVETSFYRVFRGYYSGIESGAALAALEEGAEKLRCEGARLIRGAVAIQVIVFTLAALAAPRLVDALGLPADAVLLVRLSLVAASFQILGLLGLLLLYYLDLRREALVAATLQVSSIAIATTIAIVLGASPAVGAALGSIVPAAASVWFVWRALTNLVPETFQSQPYQR
jgi:uncharacterized membrane protein